MFIDLYMNSRNGGRFFFDDFVQQFYGGNTIKKAKIWSGKWDWNTRVAAWTFGQAALLKSWIGLWNPESIQTGYVKIAIENDH